MFPFYPSCGHLDHNLYDVSTKSSYNDHGPCLFLCPCLYCISPCHATKNPETYPAPECIHETTVVHGRHGRHDGGGVSYEARGPVHDHGLRRDLCRGGLCHLVPFLYLVLAHAHDLFRVHAQVRGGDGW